jgi:hypothetical protein
MYLGRDEVDQARTHIEEAWECSGAAGGQDRHPNIQTVVPAHIGRAAFHLAIGEYHEAIKVGEAGLALVDGSGYTAWAIHHLLPIIAEAMLWLRDLEGNANRCTATPGCCPLRPQTRFGLGGCL